MHVSMADEAYDIGSGAASESYLNIPKIVKVARSAAVEGVHPGYGFLAENPLFAAACEEAGLVFIGPRSRILASSANKFESKQTIRRAGLETIPGSKAEVHNLDEAKDEAERLKFPLLIKASYGGGGRGMRSANSMRELEQSFDIAASEAKAAFGRSELYLEKYLQKPRHIEVQVIAGRRGRIVHLGERECSLQRRHQKILEETPSPGLSPIERKRLVSQALKAAKATRYENAGTVEFVRSDQGEFYYLEMNKRIQVEHLITEMVTGLDIVEQQLRLASGDGLEVSQDEVRFSGAAMNCRINAEKPSNNFAPSPGLVEEFVPANGPGVRVDSALFNGAVVPEYYDSLVAKVACYGRHRTEVIERMRVALGETVISGIETTIPVHQAILEDAIFLRGEYTTQFLDERIPRWDLQLHLSNEEVAMLYLTTDFSMDQTLTQQTLDRSEWKTRAQTERLGRPALFVEGL